MTELRRLDRLMAGRVEVAIVFREMLGVQDASVYMAGNGIPQHVADRVIAGMTTTRISDGAIVGYCMHDPEIVSFVANELRDTLANTGRESVTPQTRPGVQQEPHHSVTGKQCVTCPILPPPNYMWLR